MIRFLLKASKWPKENVRFQPYQQHFSVALANLEMNMQEDRFWRKVPSTLRKK